MRTLSSSTRLSLVATIVLLLAAVASYRPILVAGPIQPNLLLVAVIVLGFFTRSIGFFTLLIAFAALLARQTPVFFDSIALGVAVGGLLAFLVKQHVVWPDRLGVSLLVALGTTALYCVVAPRFITGHFGAFILEVFAGILVALALFELLSFILGRSHE